MLNVNGIRCICSYYLCPFNFKMLFSASFVNGNVAVILLTMFWEIGID